MSAEEPAADWLTLLGSKKRLDREKGLNKLKLLLQVPANEGTQDNVLLSIEAKLLELVLSLTSPWEERHGGLLAAGMVIQTGTASQQFCDRIKGEIPLFLEDPESRIRMAAGLFLMLNIQYGQSKW